jgi:ribonuclease P protein component
MISRGHRFHGYNSLRHAYAQGRTARGPLFSVKVAANPRRKTYRVAVVVSRKVHKSAVARNRIRRRLYAAVRAHQKDISQPYDIILTVFSMGALEEPAESLTKQVRRQLIATGAINSGRHS